MIITAHVQPNARTERVLGWRDASTIRISITAPPRDGAANRALIAFLAKRLGIAKSLITIKRGHSGRVKHVCLPEETDLSPLKS